MFFFEFKEKCKIVRTDKEAFDLWFKYDRIPAVKLAKVTGDDSRLSEKYKKKGD